MAKKIIIDTDPGIDDAMAILCAMRSPEVEIVGLTTVFGNTTIDHTTRNALRLVELEGNSHIPVAKGCSQSLLSKSKLGTFVHGMDGFGDASLPLPKGKPLQTNAVEFIIRTILDNPGEITLVPIGPLTNIALAARLEPRIIPQVKEVIVMAGAVDVPGNISPVAEANVYNDPHAAWIVYNTPWRLTMIGLDVINPVVMTNAYLEEIYRAQNPATRLIQAILPYYQKYEASFFGMDYGIGSPDTIAIAYVLKPELFQTEDIPILVLTEGACMGQTVPDRHRQWSDLPTVQVSTKVNAAGVLDLFKERISHS
jgi:purine nucleosidase